MSWSFIFITSLLVCYVTSHSTVLINETVIVDPSSYSLYDLFSDGKIEYKALDLTGSFISVYVVKRSWLNGYSVNQYYSTLSCINKKLCTLNSTDYNSLDEVVLVLESNNIIQKSSVSLYVKNVRTDHVEPETTSIYIIGLSILCLIVIITLVLLIITHIYKLIRLKQEELSPLIQV